MSVGTRLDSGDLWWKNAILYELDVETFLDGDGDGVGDFLGLIQRLDHLQALGVTCLWMMPFFPTPNRDDGYDISDYYTIDSRFGTLGDFVAFIHAADERGIRVIIDLVVNHTSDQHPWFQDACSGKEAKYRDWYVWSDEPIKEAEAIIFPGLQDRNWTQDPETGQYYFHRFHNFQPDLNLANPAVREEIMQIMRFWLQLGVAGFRFDAAPFMIETVGVNGGVNEPHHEWLEEFCLFVKRRRGDAVLLGEANLPPDQIANFFGGGHQLHGELRVALPEAGDTRREKIAAEALGRADPHRPRHRRRASADRLLRAEREPLHLFGDREQPLPLLGQHISRRAAVEELRLQRMFQGADAAGEGRVIDLEPRRCDREATASRYTEEASEIVPVKVGQVCELSHDGCGTIQMDLRG